MEERDPERRLSDSGAAGPGAVRAGPAALAGALLAAMAAAAAGYALRALHAGPAAAALQGFLSRGGWLWLPLWGAALALLLALTRPAPAAVRVRIALLAGFLALLPLALRPVVPIAIPEPSPARPSSASGKAMAIRRWAYGSPEKVATLLDYARDPDPVVREIAVQALGINRIVSDVENAGPDRPSRYATSRLRERLRDGLIAALGDPIEPVRAEAARALWKAPRTFGDQVAAAETLRAALDRAPAAGPLARSAWLALDALAKRGEPELARSARRFAAVTSDSTARRLALDALLRAGQSGVHPL